MSKFLIPILAPLLTIGLSELLIAQPQVLRVDFSDHSLFGMPVHWGRSEAALLEANGRFHIFETQRVQRHERLKTAFQPESLQHARAQLQAELGSHFETIIAGPYVIAAPQGEADRWQHRFSALLAGYWRYFEVRGCPLHRADFPLIVIVFSSREEFLRYSATQTSKLPSMAVGSYFPNTNRCILYQISDSRGVDWSETESTIVHEAVHQLAYNSGLHERLFDNPTWFVEGIATMFEEPSVYNLSLDQSTVATRMNKEKLNALQPIIRDPGNLEWTIQELITNDDYFNRDPQTAYAVAWGLTFYLAERMPRQFRSYIELQNRRRFGSYTRIDRERDFQAAFQQSPAMLVPQMTRLYSK